MLAPSASGCATVGAGREADIADALCRLGGGGGGGREDIPPSSRGYFADPYLKSYHQLQRGSLDCGGY